MPAIFRCNKCNATNCERARLGWAKNGGEVGRRWARREREWGGQERTPFHRSLFFRTLSQFRSLGVRLETLVTPAKKLEKIPNLNKHIYIKYENASSLWVPEFSLVFSCPGRGLMLFAFGKKEAAENFIKADCWSVSIHISTRWNGRFTNLCIISLNWFFLTFLWN